MKFLISELRVHKTLQKTEKIDPNLILGPAPDMISWVGTVNATVRAELIRAEVLLTGEVTLEIKEACSRCLIEFPHRLKVEFKQAGDPAAEVIDADPFIKEAVLLDLPVKTLCREACLGLCPQCGVNRNEKKCGCETETTSRKWDALSKFPFPKR